MNTKQLTKFFNDQAFSVNLFKEDGKQCAELETWTKNGVSMLHLLHPFTFETFEKVVEDFDIDEEIDLHRQDKLFRSHFSVRAALEDFEAYQLRLAGVVTKWEEEQGWVCTYVDNQQYGRKLSEGHYEFKEKNPRFELDPQNENEWVQIDILLAHYTEEQIEDHVSAHYDSVARVKEIYGEEWEWIVAECIFEQESGLY
jgi:hypothetical protein